jgi:hypothetical protein
MNDPLTRRRSSPAWRPPPPPTPMPCSPPARPPTQPSHSPSWEPTSPPPCPCAHRPHASCWPHWPRGSWTPKTRQQGLLLLLQLPVVTVPPPRQLHQQLQGQSQQVVQQQRRVLPLGQLGLVQDLQVCSQAAEMGPARGTRPGRHWVLAPPTLPSPLFSCPPPCGPWPSSRSGPLPTGWMGSWPPLTCA